jgi:hypothetical protein
MGVKLCLLRQNRENSGEYLEIKEDDMIGAYSIDEKCILNFSPKT